MPLKSELKSSLSEIVDAIASIEGVVSIVLFGSRARGDYDEGSDYDLLVIFRDEDTLWKNYRLLHEKVGKFPFFIQVLTYSMKEVEEMEPSFKEQIWKEGVILYERYPYYARSFLGDTIDAVVISYDLKHLPPSEKSKVDYALLGKRVGKKHYKGIVDKVEGLRLGYGTIIIPRDKLGDVLPLFQSRRIPYKTLEIFIPLREMKKVYDRASHP